MAFATEIKTGNGSLRSWTISFPYIHASHVKAKVKDTGEAIEVVASGSTVALGSVETTPEAGVQFLIYRETPLTPLSSFLGGTLNDAETNRIANLQVLYLHQEHADRLEELVTISDTALRSAEGALNKLAGDAEERVGKVVGFDGDGEPVLLANVPLSPTVAVSSFWQTALLTADQEAAGKALGVFGLFADNYGTGTPDDTALWTTIINNAVALGYNKIYAKRPSTVKNLNINSPIEIEGIGGFKFTLAATATIYDCCVRVCVDNVHLHKMTFEAPILHWRTPNGAQIGSRCLLVASPGSPNVPLKNIILRDIVTIGGGNGIDVYGSENLTLENIEARYCSSHGVPLRGLSHTRMRATNVRGVACGGYAITYAQIYEPTTDSRGFEDCEIRGAYALNCGKLGYWSSLGNKFGFDITTNSIKGLIFEGAARGCMSGGLEVKVAPLPPPPIIAHPILSDIDIKIAVTQDCDMGNAGVIVGGTLVANPTGMTRRITMRATVDYVGPAEWIEDTFYEVGTAVKNGGKVYLCGGTADGVGGISGGLGAPTGTGIELSSYFDGTLYWVYLNTNDTVPATDFQGARFDGCGDPTTIIHMDGLTVTGAGYFALLMPSSNEDATIYNLVFDNPLGRNCKYGIYDNGNYLETGTPASIVGLRINNPDIEATFGAAITLGSVKGPTTVEAKIFGGRCTGSNGLRLEGGSVTLEIDGDTQFYGTTEQACVLHSSGVEHHVSVGDATFENLTTGHAVWQSDTPAGSWTNWGNVWMAQPDTARKGYLVNSGSVTFSGAVYRGMAASAPGDAGNIGEIIKKWPITTTASRYECTTAGNAGVAVWTAKV